MTDWYANLRAENDLVADDYRRRHEADCAAGRHYWRPNGPGHSCSTCHTYSTDQSLTDCPNQGRPVRR